MFHLKYNQKPNFFNWAELGCLARALGYKLELFKEHITDEILHTSEGVSLKELIKMIEYKVLQTILHQTFNLHTADWNMCVIKKSFLLLNHKALTFEELNTVRIGYEMYEAIDMKGMPINKHVIQRSIKMCGRMIAPLKLMHRVKHMKTDFDEKGRMQLYEFLDLILWCDLYACFYPDEQESGNEKQNKLFKLVDFEKLLSHHDERMSGQLNTQFLQDEWDFGIEKLGSKRLFKNPTVHTEFRIKRTVYHKENYKYLKGEINNSQKQVYHAKAGFVRPRPVTAPQLSHYKRKFNQKTMTERSVSEAYKIVQRRLRSSLARPSSRLPERPKTSEYHRIPTPPVVTRQELVEFHNKLGSLQFDITTVKTRAEEDLYGDMDLVLPGFRQKKANEPKSVVIEPVKMEEKPKKNIGDIMEGLTHPQARNPKYHFKSCDARHRGWYTVGHKKGLQRVLIDPPHNESPNGYFTKELQKHSESHPPQNFIYRYTKKKSFIPLKGHPKYLPQTAPVSKTCPETSIHMNQKCDSASQISTTKSEEQNINFMQESIEGRSIHSPEITNEMQQTPAPQTLMSVSPEKNKPISEELNFKFTSFSPTIPKPSFSEIEYPIPAMKHSKPKIVKVGHIGRIKLLENIMESQDLEELLYEPRENIFKPPNIQISNNLSDSIKLPITTLNINTGEENIEDLKKTDFQESPKISEDENLESLQLNLKLQKVEENNEPKIPDSPEKTFCREINTSKRITAWEFPSKSEENYRMIEDKKLKDEQFEPNDSDAIVSCHKFISAKVQNSRNDTSSYSRLAKRVNDPTSYFQRRLLSVSSS